jgi:hypothetical protein
MAHVPIRTNYFLHHMNVTTSQALYTVFAKTPTRQKRLNKHLYIETKSLYENYIRRGHIPHRCDGDQLHD